MTLLACVEVGGSGCQTVMFDGDRVEIVDGAVRPPGAELAMAVPGLIDGVRVAVASNLGWVDVDPAAQLGLAGPAMLVLNDGEAAALGEAALRSVNGVLADLAFVGLGTGVGGAVVIGGQVVAANLFGHAPGFSELTCRCGLVGCLETVAAGWALPTEITTAALHDVAAHLVAAIRAESFATPSLVVIGGGLAAANPRVVDLVRSLLPDRQVEASVAPEGMKSASAWGLRHALHHLARASDG